MQHSQMRPHFSGLLVQDPARRKLTRLWLLSNADPHSVCEAAFEEYDRTGQGELLLHARGLLEDFGPGTWDALKQIAGSGREECELFIGPIVRCSGVRETERIEALQSLASNPSPFVRSRLYEYLGQLTHQGKRAVLDVLAKDPDFEISEEAAHRLSSLDEDL
ncbi:MAG: hypothetical protein ACLQVF_37710 [Isosphaeraceae bacterium]